MGRQMGKGVGKQFALNSLINIKLFFALWCLIAVFGAFVGGLTYHWPRYKAKHMFFLASKRIDELVFFMEKQRRSVVELARSVYMQDLMSFQVGESEITQQQTKKMQSFLKEYQASFGYSHIFLINLDGRFIFSTMEDLIGKNIKDKAYQGSLITQSFEFIHMTLTSDNSDFAYDAIVKKEALFITMPVSFQGKLRGFLAVQVSNDKMQKELHHYEGLGKSGEYVIASLDKNHYTYVLPPRLTPDLAFTTRQLSENLDLPIEKAIMGYEGYGVQQNDHDEYIVAAWKYVPQFNWGLVVKVDYDELMFYAYILRYIVYGLIPLAIILMALLIFKMVRHAQMREKQRSEEKTK